MAQIDETTFSRVNRDGDLEVIDMISGEVLTSSKPIVTATRYEYSPSYGRAICALIREGKTYKDLKNLPGVPPLNIIYTWRERYPDFRENLELARMDRADHYHDAIIEAVDNINDRESAAVETARINALKWAAEKGNPRKYGQKVELENKVSGEVGFYVLDTGIKPPKKELSLVEETDKIEEIIEVGNNKGSQQ